MPTSLNDALQTILADATLFYQKLRHYHWDVRGPGFFELHAAFEEAYDSFAAHIDEVAERIAALGGQPAPTLASIIERSSLKEEGDAPAADEMVRRAAADLATQSALIKDAIGTAEEAGDRTTVNLLDAMNDDIEKRAWMLRSFLGK